MRRLSMVATAVVTIAAATSAAPVPLYVGPVGPNWIEPNTQSCTGKQTGDFLWEYIVNVGEPYIGGAGCDSIWNALNTSVKVSSRHAKVGDLGCVDGGWSNTMLGFACFECRGSDISSGLDQVCGLKHIGPALAVC